MCHYLIADLRASWTEEGERRGEREERYSWIECFADEGNEPTISKDLQMNGHLHLPSRRKEHKGVVISNISDATASGLERLLVSPPGISSLLLLE